jgi:hypothetical protein
MDLDARFSSLDAVMLGRRCDGGVRLGVRAHPEREERHEGDSPLRAHVEDLFGGFDLCVSHPRPSCLRAIIASSDSVNGTGEPLPM